MRRWIGFSCLWLFAAVVAVGSIPPRTKGDPTAKDESGEPAFVEAALEVTEPTDAKLIETLEKLTGTPLPTKTEAEDLEVSNRVQDALEKLIEPAQKEVMKIVRPHAAEPNAVGSLFWVVDRNRRSVWAAEAVSLMQKHHPDSPETLRAITDAGGSPMEWTIPLLESQLASPNLPKEWRVRTLLALAVSNQTICQLHLLSDGLTDGHKALYKRMFGNDIFVRLQKVDVEKREAEAVRLHQKLIDEHADEPNPSTGTIGEFSRIALREMRHLTVGKTAPEIVGKDIEGNRIELSDLRGKIVILHFWKSDAPASLDVLPQYRELLKRYGDKPFAILGINGDRDIETARATSGRERMTWPSVWSGQKGEKGELPLAWNVSMWPRMWIVDTKGTLRQKALTRESLDRFIGILIAELTNPKQ